MFEDIVALSVGVKSCVESLGLAWPGLIVVESDGGIEDTDTLRSVAEGATQLGLTVFDNSFDDALEHPATRLRQRGVADLASQCQSCELVSVCGGGHVPHRYQATTGYRNPSVYCRDLEFLIRHIQRSVAARTVSGAA